MRDVMNSMRVPLLQIFQMVERLFPVKELDVLCLRRGQPAYGPAEVHEVWLERTMQRMHVDLVGQMIRLARVARRWSSRSLRHGRAESGDRASAIHAA